MSTPAQELWVYQPGNLHARTTIRTHADGSQTVDFNAGVSVIDYMTRINMEREAGSPEYGIYTWAEFRALIDSHEDKLCEAWEEIEREKWHYALECLPPEKWQSVDGVNIFRMCEYYTGNITSHYARINTPSGMRYFTALRRTSVQYSVIAKEVFEAAQTPSRFARQKEQAEFSVEKEAAEA